MARSRLLSGVSTPILGRAAGGTLPVGSIQYLAADPGAAFLRCDGTAFSQTAYPALVAAIPRFLGFKRGYTGINVGYPIKGIAYGKGLWIAVAGAGNILTSPDGVNWTPRYVDAGNPTLVAVVFGGNKFVAIDANTYVYTSTDGITWNYTGAFPEQGSRTNYCIAYGAGLYVVGRNSGVLMTSSDGITWTARNPGFSTQRINGITFANGMFIAVTGNAGGSTISTSPDGIVWTVRNTPATNETFNDVEFGNGVYAVAGGNLARLYYSTDLTNWTTVFPGGGYGVLSISYGDGLWVVTDMERVNTSPDLTNWTSQKANLGGDVNNCYATHFADNRHVAGVVQNTCSFSMFSTPTIPQGVLPSGQTVVPYMKAA